jgi:hypothetical protein
MRLCYVHHLQQLTGDLYKILGDTIKKRKEKSSFTLTHGYPAASNKWLIVI